MELWRYPVKSLQGERIEATTVTPEGFEGDRRLAIFDAETGFGLTARRVPELLFASARMAQGGEVEITLPDGSPAPDDEALSSWLGRPVRLRSPDQVARRRYENPVDFEEEEAWEPFEGAGGAFHDRGKARVSLVSAGSLGAWDRRRFRANVVLDEEGEDALVGWTVALGGAELEVAERLSRCVMTTRPQPGAIGRDLDVLRTLGRQRDGCLAVGAVVTRPGRVQVGDAVRPVA